MAMTASKRPLLASRCATKGISNEPGTHATVICSSRAPWRRRPSRAPCSSWLVISPLKRETTMANRKPSALKWPSKMRGMVRLLSTVGWRAAPAGGRFRARARHRLQIAAPVAEFLLLGAQVVLVGGVGWDLDGHPLHDLDAVRFQPHDLAGIVGQEADAGQA